MGRTVETRRLEVRLLGPVTVLRDGAPVSLPRSRKVRALLAYLALASGPLSRSRLCGLLWDVPNDPRGELRWCLSKLRGVLDDGERRRVVTSGQDLIALDLSDAIVDAIAVDRAVREGIAGAPRARLEELSKLFAGELLEGLAIDGNPELTGWVAAQRHRYRTTHAAVLAELAVGAPGGPDAVLPHLHAWLQVAPFEVRAHEMLLEALVRSGRAREAEEHVAVTMRAFEQESVDWAPLRDAWRAVRVAAAPPPSAEISSSLLVKPAALSARSRASIAVMPFTDVTAGPDDRRIADGLTEDIITRLAKLRVLFVIARGTTFALNSRGVGPEDAGRILGVQYVASGRVRRHGARVVVVVELVHAEDASIVWTDELEAVADETFTVLDAIVDRIVAAIAREIETAESNRALLKPPSSLDAWEAYHRGLWHMYKFNGPDNRDAEHYFRASLQLDPTFSRAFAGLSFTHFQNAFLGLTPDKDRQIDLALEAAGKSLGADARDPAAHWAMGRALWLSGSLDESIAELQHSIELSPNFALGHYTLGFVQSQSGDAKAAIDATTTSRQLSPFDPLQFAMLASRAIAHLRLGELEEAATWAVKATGRPNAHAHILAIAASCLALTSRRDDARRFVAQIRARVPGYSVEDFLRAFRFPPETERLFRQGAKAIGFDG